MFEWGEKADFAYSLSKMGEAPRRARNPTWFASAVAAVLMLASNASAEEAGSSGTGFLINSDGWAVTNAHVLENCTRADVSSIGPATDWILDRQNDIAAVRVADTTSRQFLKLRSSPPRLGEDIAALGYPLHGVLSDSIKITTGNINSKVGLDNDTRYLQVSTPLQPGNSGGPIVDRSGAVVGVATAVLGSRFAERTGFIPQNVNFAVHASVLALFLESRGIAFDSVSVGEDLSTADLADAVSPSVVQILCFEEAISTPVAVAPPASPNPAMGSSDAPEQRAIQFARLYHDAWSSSNELALAYMADVYSGDVTFYGKSVSPTVVMGEKRKFAQRWPVRDYSIRDGSLSTNCVEHSCVVRAVVDWFAHSPARQRSANGVATFEFTLDTERMAIVRESGSVLKGHAAVATGMLNRWHDLNGRCRGGHGDNPATERACSARDYTDSALASAGWCYGRDGEAGYQMEWHRCDRTSLSRR